MATANRKYLDPNKKNMAERFDRMFEILQQEKPLNMKEKVCFDNLGEKIKMLEDKNE